MLLVFIITAIPFILLAVIPKNGEFVRATYYKATGDKTASGETYYEDCYTCAVRDREDMGHWYIIHYKKRSVRVWANDIIPSYSAAYIDLTPIAFQDLAPLKKGVLWVTVERDNSYATTSEAVPRP